ncbi:hypothetical protein [Deinococcus sp.]|uniref:hypothetical protein n=1 Tax=Deinococcus sp. TaxID=47478 RepID=UPI0025F0AF96|nr:hypothetical protein [Deinococcus sp.]
MKLKLSWAQRRFLGLTGEVEDSDLDEQFPLDLRLSRSALDSLLAHLEVTGTHRSGPLYGYHREVVDVAYALTGIPPMAVLGNPLALDPAYTLGGSEALRLTDPALDWVGHWVCAPGGLLPDTDASVALIEQAVTLKLIGTRSPLVIVGWDGVDFVVRPYLFNLGDILPMRASWIGGDGELVMSDRRSSGPDGGL